MSFNFDFNKNKRIVFSHIDGEMTDDDLISHVERISDCFKKGILNQEWCQVIDLRKAEINVQSSTIRQVAIRNPWPEKSLRIIIAESKLQYGLSRMYQMMGDPKTEAVVLVRTRREAMDYIAESRGNKDDRT